MDFKTNAKCSGCVAAITGALKDKFPNGKFEIDLESDDKVLHVHGVPEDSEHIAQIENAIAEAGFKGAWLTRGLENK